MPKSITFFSRGKTPIYVNYVIAHNTRAFLARQIPTIGRCRTVNRTDSSGGRPAVNPVYS